MNTSSERVDSLMRQSDHIYSRIDRMVDGQKRSHRIVKLGINAVALELKIGTIETAGQHYQTILSNELNDVPARAAFKPYPQYDDLDALAHRYGTVERATLETDGSFESDARHAVHLSALAVPYAQEYYPHLNIAKVVIYCLIHDIIEAYTGDVPTLGISDANLALKHEAENAALHLLARDYGVKWPEFVRIIQDYEALADAEARYVKTFDKLDPSFTHYTSRGTQFIHAFGYTNKNDLLQTGLENTARIQVYGSEFPGLLDDRWELFKRVADHTEWPATDIAFSR